jgi:hypothetical protein
MGKISLFNELFAVIFVFCRYNKIMAQPTKGSNQTVKGLKQPTFPELTQTFKYFPYLTHKMAMILVGIVGLPERSLYAPDVATVANDGLPDRSLYAPLVATVESVGLPERSL